MKPFLNLTRWGVLLLASLFLFSYSDGQVRVACLGASVAAGFGVDPSQAYPSQMGVILGNNWNVMNFGESGSTLLVKGNSPYVQRPNYPLSLASSPDIVTIELGSNDSKPYNWVYKDNFISDYSKLIDTFRSLPSHPVIYICLPIPAYTNNYDLDNNAINEMLPLVRQVAALKHTGLIDLNTPLQNHADWYQSDGIHPNATGARQIAEVISKVLAAPVNLSATVVSKTQINLNWTDRTSETNFKIQRSADSVSWNDIATVGANTTSYADAGLTATTRYYYRTYATISIGNSAYSNIATAVTAAGANPPVISSALTANGVAGTAFQYTIVASNNPQSYNAIGLPEGLSINRQTGVISGMSVSSGVFNVSISASNTDGTATKTLILTLGVPATELPYSGTPFSLPGKIEAEQFDKGGQGVAYNDNDIQNQGGQFRTTEGVDIEACSEGGYDVGYILAGEWMKYSVNVAVPGSYTLETRLAAPGEGGLLHVELDGVNISGAITVPNTAGYQTWQSATVVTPLLSTGNHVLRVIIDAGGFNINYLNFTANKPVIQHAATVQGVTAVPFKDTITATFNPGSYAASGLPAGLGINTGTGIISGTPLQAGTFNVTLSATNVSGTGSRVVTFNILGTTPFTGTPVTLPGKVEVEDYDLGGPGVAYFDTDANNHSGQYRPDDGVDVEGCGEGGYDIGGIAPDEWTSYTVNVALAGVYTLQARVASPFSGTSFHVELNGQNISGSIPVPNTGDWQAYQTVTVTTPSLSVGKQVLRVVMETDGFNLNYLRFVNNADPNVSKTLPGRIEAEEYDNMTGVQLENTGDTNGMQDVGWIDAGDWMDYKVNVALAGTYTFSFRVASPGGGQLQLRSGANILATVNIPSTGDWQVWSTLNTTVNLAAGDQTLRIYAATGGWNINWFQGVSGTAVVAPLVATVPASSSETDDLRIYPNPATTSLTVDQRLLRAAGKSSVFVYSVATGISFTVPASGNVLDVSKLPAGVYVISFSNGSKSIQKTFVKL